MSLTIDTRLDTVFAFVVSEEGSTYVDNPEDSGGCCKYGIILTTWQNYCGDHSLTCKDIDNITFLQAKAVFKKNYWGVGSALPDGLCLSVSDMAFNAGYRTATTLLQRSVGATEDGVLGPKTLARISVYPTDYVIEKFGEVCAAYYKQIPNHVFTKGWLARNERRTKAALDMISELPRP